MIQNGNMEAFVEDADVVMTVQDAQRIDDLARNWNFLDVDSAATIHLRAFRSTANP
jgi:hypothetical protein